MHRDVKRKNQIGSGHLSTPRSPLAISIPSRFSLSRAPVRPPFSSSSILLSLLTSPPLALNGREASLVLAHQLVDPGEKLLKLRN